MDYYTKEITLNSNYKGGINTTRLEIWTGNLKKAIKENKIIFISLIMLTTLITADLILINSFLNILAK